ncbi:4-amino-4-deoxy-L-arabinose transferase-like glycosyltransferase [Actinomycetospora succinea]|uniref:4-amino-4-deoxy-L-arabinose transferase-like glycosyltransferase n=1 Tax=Actinomycetospora succinea TaxID=663603 RepID=A0A4R6VD83_9PSEU|nr:arabinosyltransferase domain-containing protein [Actinomycetospora succinea]TDQ60753.1 4-amino-4-deoxy-L-arabinose transferase-like glycosyltransferase [Actinomycetospora succinea]
MSTDAPTRDRQDADDLPPHRRTPVRSIASLTAVVAGLVAIVGALLLPFAPVSVSTPQVSWPPDPRVPAPAMLPLTAYEPASLEARFSCRTARAAGESPDGVVLSTMGPESPDARQEALTVVSRGGAVAIRSGGADLFTGPLPPGDCGFLVTGDGTTMRVAVNGAVLSTTGPRPPEDVDPDELPDSEPLHEPISPMPEVDALRTSAPVSPAATPADLSVRLVLDDAFDHTPTPLKSALIGVTLAALAVGAAAMVVLAVLAARADPTRTRVAIRLRRRLSRRPGAAPWGLRPRVLDVVVPGVLVAWLFLAPITDDDGYYSAMAANVPFSGYVPNYFQLFNQGYTPFSWPYYALSWWEDTVGFGPVMLRIPALVLGIGTWFLARWYVSSTPLLGPRGQSAWWAPALARLTLAAAFLAWFLAYDMGVRPEPVVAFFTVATLVAVAEGLERRRLALLGLAVGLSMAGLMAAPTGFITLAPLVAAAPAMWRHIRERSATPWAAAGRWVVVLGPVAVGSLLGFADGAYRDFVRSQNIFAPIQRAQTWYEEVLRYDALLDTMTHHGSYARRVALLVCFLALVWFLVLLVAARARDLVVPARLPLAGWSTLLAFALLLPTPSKPTHHFGAFAGLGAILIALVLVEAPRLLAGLDRHRRVPQVALVAAAVSSVLVFALAGHGRAMWPHGWGLGRPSEGDFPSVQGIEYDQPLWWALGLLVVTAVVWALARWRAPHLQRLALGVAVPVMACVLLLTFTLWTVGDFVRATGRTADGWSPQVDALRDPTGVQCGLANQIDVLDPRNSRVLPPAVLPGLPPSPPIPAVDDLDAPAPEARTEPFVPGAFFPQSPLPPDVPVGTPAWGSFLVPSSGANADARQGVFATDWFRLPPADRGGVVVSVSGRTGTDVSLRAEYGRLGPTGFVPMGSTPVATEDESTAWRPVALTEDADPTPAGGAQTGTEVDPGTGIRTGSATETGSGAGGESTEDEPALPNVAPPPGAEIVRLVADDRSASTGGWLAFTAPMERSWVPLQQYLPAGAAVGLPWQIGFLFPCQRQPRQQAGITEPVVAAVGYGKDVDAALADWAYNPARGGLLGHAGREAPGGEPTQLTTRIRGVGDEIDDVYVFDLRPPYPANGYDLTRERRTESGLP